MFFFCISLTYVRRDKTVNFIPKMSCTRNVVIKSENLDSSSLNSAFLQLDLKVINLSHDDEKCHG